MTLLLFGFLVGTIGTLIGAGGGFIMMPFLLFYYPDHTTESLTAISLAVVFANAVSGSLNYAYKRRIDYQSVILFSIASTPGAIAGAYLTSFIPLRTFELVFGFVMVLISIYLLLSKKSGRPNAIKRSSTQPHRVRVLVDREGVRHEIAYSKTIGVSLSVVVGFVSSLLGIGGGIIHVPALVELLAFPVHIATATSHGVLAFTALVGTLMHIWHGDLSNDWGKILWLAPGVILGAQLGAQLSGKMKGSWIIRLLATALLSVGLRLIFR